MKRLVRIISILMIIAAGLLLCVMGRAFFDGTFDSVDSMQSFIAGYGAFAPILLTSFQALQVIIPAVPGFFGCAVGTVLFGPTIGFLCNYVGIGAGSLIAFFLARRYGMPLVRTIFPKEKYSKWSSWASKSKSYTAFLFLAMLLPLFPDDYLCYLTGVSEMEAKKFVWIIILGKPWCLLAYCLGFSLIK